MRYPAVAALALTVGAAPALAGPPYITDDPVPTDTGHWEIYAFAAGEGRHSTLDGDAGFDLNYGGFKNVQLTATLPLSISHTRSDGWHGDTGDVEIALKYRFINNEGTGFAAAIFPRAILPTAAHDPGERMHVLIPVWLEKDFAGGTSVFGGGGYTIGSRTQNKDFWQAAMGVTQQFRENLSVGAEIAGQGPDVSGGTNQIRAGLGAIIHLTDHYNLLLSGGPTWADHQTSYRFYTALGLNL